MTQPYRVNGVSRIGIGVESSQRVQFSFDNRSYQGLAGDTLASALLANGVHLVGRSFKYHRPRGILTAGSEEPNAIVELRDGARREPNTRATMIELFDQLQANSQNRFPSLQFDLLSVNQLLAPFLTAGFYYKTFMWPASLWESVYEKIIRRSAGLGRAATEADPDTYEHAHKHADVLIVGAGPTGLAAARAAAASGARVVLVEEQPWAGGWLSSLEDEIEGVRAYEWVASVMSELQAMPNVDVMLRTTLFGYYDSNVMAALERVNDHRAQPLPHQPRQRMWTIRAKEVVLAGGAQERPMVFPGNDRPGVMLSTAVRRYVERYAVAPGKRVAIATTNDDGYLTARVLRAAGVDVAVVADARATLSAAAEAARQTGLDVRNASLPVGVQGGKRVSGLRVENLSGNQHETIACDCVAMAGGFSPDVHLASQGGVLPVWDAELVGFVPGEVREGANGGRRFCSAGAANGDYALDACLAEGHRAGGEAATRSGHDAAAMDAPTAAAELANSFATVWQCPGVGKSFVDFQNDVSAQDIRLAYQEGLSLIHI